MQDFYEVRLHVLKLHVTRQESQGRGNPPLPGPIKWISACTSTRHILGMDSYSHVVGVKEVGGGWYARLLLEFQLHQHEVSACDMTGLVPSPYANAVIITSFDVCWTWAFSQAIKLFFRIKGLFLVSGSGVKTAFLFTEMV